MDTVEIERGAVAAFMPVAVGHAGGAGLFDPFMQFSAELGGGQGVGRPGCGGAAGFPAGFGGEGVHMRCG